MTSKIYLVGKVEKDSPSQAMNRENQPTHYTSATQPTLQSQQMSQSHSLPVSSTNGNTINTNAGTGTNSNCNATNSEKLYNSATQQNHVGNVILAGVPIVSLFIDSKERLCLAQISNTLLSKYSYNEIHNRRVALGITCVQCTPVQLEMLRRAGAMPVSSRRCGMITKREAERLVRSFLEESTPPKLPDDFTFSVYHECGWGCQGSFHPSRYNSSRAKCIKCNFCNLFFSPNKFIFHFHRTANSKYNHPDAANFNSWRRHLKLYGENSENNEFVYAWEDVKAMFNGGGRKRLQGGSSSSSSATPNLSSSHPHLEKRQKLEPTTEGLPNVGISSIGSVGVIGPGVASGATTSNVIVKERSPYAVPDCQPFSMFPNPLRGPSFQTPNSYGLALTGTNTTDQLIPSITSNPWGTNQTNFLMATYDRFWASHLGLSRPTTEYQTNPYFAKALPNRGPKEMAQSINLTPSSSEEEDSGTSSSNEEDLNKPPPPPLLGHRLSAFRPVNPVNNRPKSSSVTEAEMPNLCKTSSSSPSSPSLSLSCGSVVTGAGTVGADALLGHVEAGRRSVGLAMAVRDPRSRPPRLPNEAKTGEGRGGTEGRESEEEGQGEVEEKMEVEKRKEEEEEDDPCIEINVLDDGEDKEEVDFRGACRGETGTEQEAEEAGMVADRVEGGIDDDDDDDDGVADSGGGDEREEEGEEEEEEEEEEEKEEEEEEIRREEDRRIRRKEESETPTPLVEGARMTDAGQVEGSVPASRAVAVISENRNRPEVGFGFSNKHKANDFKIPEMGENSTQQQLQQQLHHHQHHHHHLHQQEGPVQQNHSHPQHSNSHHHQHQQQQSLQQHRSHLQQQQHYHEQQQLQLKQEESDEDIEVDERRRDPNDIYRRRFEQTSSGNIQRQQIFGDNEHDQIRCGSDEFLLSTAATPDILSMSKEQLHEQLIQEIKSRRKIEKECQIIKETFEEQVKQDRKHRNEMQQQINLVQESLTSELEQERKARLTLQEKLKETYNAVHSFSCKMLASRFCGQCNNISSNNNKDGAVPIPR